MLPPPPVCDSGIPLGPLSLGAKPGLSTMCFVAPEGGGKEGRQGKEEEGQALWSISSRAVLAVLTSCLELIPGVSNMFESNLL